MRRDAKASSAGSIAGSGAGRGLFRRAFATRGASTGSNGTGAPSIARSGALLAIATSLLLGAFAPAAMAAVEATPSYGVTGIFGGSGTGNGKFTHPTRLAVEPGTGNIFVVDSGNGRVQVFAPNGDSADFLTSFGQGALTAPFGIAIDQMTGVIYVTSAPPLGGGTGKIVKFKADNSTNPPTYSEDPSFASPAEGANAGEVGSFSSAIAIDPVTHDLLVADTANKRVERFTSAGAEVPPFNGAVSSSGSLTGPLDIAVGLTGAVYVVDAEGNVVEGAESHVRRFTVTGAAAGELAGITSPTSVAVDPGSGRVLVGGDSFYPVNPRSLYGFEADGAPVLTAKLAADPEPYAAQVSGLAAAASGRVYASGDRTFGYGTIRVQALIPDPIPGVEFGEVSAVGAKTAHVTATAAAGGVSTTVRFEYSSNGTDWTADPDQTAIGGSGEEAIDADLTLRPSTEYSVRVRAANAYLSTTAAVVGTFKTSEAPPDVSDESAANLAPNSATLNGTVVPNGPQTTYHFEYGQTTDYGQSFPLGFGEVAGSGNVARAATGSIVGLAPSSLYHYRLVATNALGITHGDDHTFTTTSIDAAACPNDAIRDRQRAMARPECRAYEQVSPIAKGGAALSSIFSGSWVNEDGNRIVYSMERANYPGSTSVPLVPKNLSVRSATGWSTRSVDPPAISTVPAGNSFYFTVTVSKDLTRALVTSRLELTPDAPAGGGLYVRDLETDEYHFVAPLDLSGTFGPFGFVGASDDLRTVALREGLLWHEATGLETVVPGGAAAQNNRADVEAVSSDGSRAYFETSSSGGTALGTMYLSEGDKLACVSCSDRPENFGSKADGYLVDASADGRYAIFVTTVPLSSDTPPGTGGEFSYRYDAETDTLKFITGGVRPAGGAILARAEAGIIYYTDGSTNYYAQNGVSKYIGGPGPDEPPNHGGVASPDGRYFFSGNILYDAATDTVSCPPCRTDGGPELGPPHTAAPVDPGVIGRHKPSPVLNDGTVFFDTPNPLVPSDSNGTRDVYIYNHGKVSLLTPGRQSVDSELVNISPDGSSVFFYTTAPLVGQDKDRDEDLYVSRVNGGLASQNPDPPVECLRDDCKGTPGVGPELPFGGSEGLTGPENFKPKARKRCAKGRHQVRARGKSRCVRKHQGRAKNERRQAR